MKRILVYLYLGFLISCVTLTKTIIMPNFDVQGHRGCRGLMPENTVAAMLYALEQNVNTLEMDISITKDEQVILSHEAFFNHELSTKPNGILVTEAEEKSLKIYTMNYDSVIKYDVGLKVHPRFLQQKKQTAVKPTLQDVIIAVINWCNVNKKPIPFFNIETKCLPQTDNIYRPDPPKFVELLMQVILKNKLQQNVIIQSFDFRTLQYLHLKYPKIKTAMLIEEEDKLTLDEQIKKLGFVPTIYSPNYNLVNEELIKMCHLQKIKIIPWTVNTKTEINKLKELGVDGIITDYPNLFNEK
jgi:glycerophosphoryl diester phosphodiesterase